MNSTFNSALNFNDDLSGWTVSAVTDMSYMFTNARKFNKDIGNWDTHKVTSFYTMFDSAFVFDNAGSNSISGWTTSAATGGGSMGYVFHQAYAFNRNITNYNQ